MHTILKEGETGAWFDIATNKHVPCGFTKRIYVENDGLHVTDSRHDVAISFAISSKKLVGLGLALAFAACLDLLSMSFRNALEALRQGRSSQLARRPADDSNNITAVECASPIFEARDYRYIRTRPR